MNEENCIWEISISRPYEVVIPIIPGATAAAAGMLCPILHSTIQKA